jgi:hypothetical protein
MKWDECGDCAIIDSDGQIIGEAFQRVSRDSTRPAKANAQLWAAAPSLYEAAKGILAAFEAKIFVRNIDGDNDPTWAMKALPHLRALAMLYEAVNKVDGVKDQ